MKIVFCVIALVQSLFADCAVGNLDDVNEADAELKEECEHLLGGGGIYISSISLSTSLNTCDGMYMENAYVLRYGCNTCKTKNVKDRLKQDTIACTKQCRMTMNACMSVVQMNGAVIITPTNIHPVVR